MDKPVGGRGKSAPYKSTHVRIPEPIKGRVEELKELFFTGQLDEYYKKLALNEELADKYSNEKDNTNNADIHGDLVLTSKSDILSLSRNLISQKKSAKITVSKLLTGLLGEDIGVDDLL